jgi:regulatory protein YycI of two-component signal transduction system YycFG
MDWPRAKYILIVVFLILNLFLFLIIGSYKLDIGASKEILSDIDKILDDRGVTIKCSVPAYKKNIPYIILENGNEDITAIGEKLLGEPVDSFGEGVGSREMTSGNKKVIIKNDNTLEYYNFEPSEHIEMMDIDQVEEYARRFLKHVDIKTKNYKLDSYIENSEGDITLFLVQKHKNFYIFGNYIKIDITKKGINKLVLGYKKIKGFSSDSVVSVMPVLQVLLKNSDIIRDVTITDIDIGFKGFFQPVQEMQKSSEGPSWRIITEEGDCWYFKVSDGEPVM